MVTGSERIQRISVVDQVYDYLVRQITDGEYKAGDKLPSENELASRLGVSRATVKVAIQKLNTMGVAETRIGDGTYIKDFGFSNYFSELLDANIIQADQKQIHNFRVLLEYCAIRLIAMNPIDDDQFDVLAGILARMKIAIRENKNDDFHRAHYEFHHQICQMAGNIFFIKLYESLDSLLAATYRRNAEKTWESLGREETIRHHEAIFNALKERNLEELTRLQDELLTDSNIQ